jgi:hypothetical protein
MQAREGGCFCGAIRYRVAGAPVSSLICHCASCRRAGGAPSVAWLTFDRQAMEFIRGEPRSRRSSPDVVRRFCGVCGTGITYEHAADPDTIDVTTASMDDPTAFPPTREVWVEEKLWWEAFNNALDQYPRDIKGGPYAGT